MSLVKWAFVGLVLFPAAEIGALILVAVMIGWLWTIALLLASSAGGRDSAAIVPAQRSRPRPPALARDGLRAVHLETPGLAPMLGGILLVLPGFITDVLGVALLVPPLRRWAANGIGQSRPQAPAPRADPPSSISSPTNGSRLPDRRPKGRGKPKARSDERPRNLVRADALC